MAKEKEALEFIEITRPTRVEGKACGVGDILSVGQHIDVDDAQYLCGIGKATKSNGKPSKAAAEKAAAEKAGNK